jgi:hypothetical protein
VDHERTKTELAVHHRKEEARRPKEHVSEEAGFGNHRYFIGELVSQLVQFNDEGKGFGQYDIAG